MYSSNAFFALDRSESLDNDLRAVGDGNAEGIIPPICALCMNWANASLKTERDVFMTDCPQAITW